MPVDYVFEFAPRQLLQHMLTLLKKVTRTTSYLAVILVDSTITVTTFGVPYLQYRLYGYNEENGISSGETYSEIIEALEAQWDTYSCLSSNMLPLLFPMVAASGVSLCSTANSVAIVTLTVGIVSVATSTIYKLQFKALHNDDIINEWKRASERPWRKVPNKSFWVLMSLPTLVFFSSISLLLTTIVLVVWERPVAGMTPSLPEVHGCRAKLQAFKYILLATLAAAGTHFAFIITKIYSMTTLKGTGIAETD